MSIKLGRPFGNLYEGCDSLKILCKIKNDQSQSWFNLEPKLIFETYCVKLVDLAYTNG